MSNPWGQNTWNDDDNDDLLGEGEYGTQNDHCVIIIDCRDNMFEMNRNGEICWRNAIRAALHYLKMTIVRNERNTVGLIFYGTKEKSCDDPSIMRENIMLVYDLSVPSAHRIRELEKMAKIDFNFDEKYGITSRLDDNGNIKICPLRDALVVAQQIFARAGVGQKSSATKGPPDNKRIWLFTNDDSPNIGFDIELRRVETMANDLRESGIELHLWHQNRGIKYNEEEKKNDDDFNNKIIDFDVKKVFLKLISIDPEEYSSRIIPGGSNNFDHLLYRIRKKENKKRRLCSVPFNLIQNFNDNNNNENINNDNKKNDNEDDDDDEDNYKNMNELSFGVQVYNLIYPQIKRSPLNLAANSNKPLRVTTKYIDDDNGNYLDPDTEICTYIDIGGGSKIYISKNEMNQCKDFGPPGITLLGTLNYNDLDLSLNLSSPYFLYPDENSIRGSSQAFISFWKSLIKFNLIGIAYFIRTKSSPPILVAILPQLEIINEEEGTQVTPQGLHMIPLPYSNDIRDIAYLNHIALVKSTDEQNEKAIDLINSLTLQDFEYENFENPTLQKHYAVLQNIALKNFDEIQHGIQNNIEINKEDIDDDWNEIEDDTTLPDFESMTNPDLQNIFNEFIQVLGGKENLEDNSIKKKTGTPSKKRKAGDDGNNDNNKKAKTIHIINDVDMQKRIDDATINKLNMNELKTFLKSKKIKVGGKKQALIDRVIEYFN